VITSIFKEIFLETKRVFIKTLIYLFIIFFLLVGSTQFAWTSNYYYVYYPYEKMDYYYAIELEYGKKNFNEVIKISKSMVEELVLENSVIIVTIPYPYSLQVEHYKVVNPTIAIVYRYEDISLLGVDIRLDNEEPILVFTESLSNDGAPPEILGKIKEVSLIINDINISISMNVYIHSQPLFEPKGLLIIKYGSKEYLDIISSVDFYMSQILIKDDSGSLGEIIRNKVVNEYGLNMSVYYKPDVLEVMESWSPSISNLLSYSFMSYWIGVILGSIILIRNSFLFVDLSKEVVGLYLIYGVPLKRVIMSFIILLLILSSMSIFLSTVSVYFVFTYIDLIKQPPLDIFLTISSSTIFLTIIIMTVLSIAFIKYRFSSTELEDYVSTGVA